MRIGCVEPISGGLFHFHLQSRWTALLPLFGLVLHPATVARDLSFLYRKSAMRRSVVQQRRQGSWILQCNKMVGPEEEAMMVDNDGQEEDRKEHSRVLSFERLASLHPRARIALEFSNSKREIITRAPTQSPVTWVLVHNLLDLKAILQVQIFEWVLSYP